MSGQGRGGAGCGGAGRGGAAPGASGVWAVVPVKPFAAAKRRLAPALAPAQRARLARAMLDDVLAALVEVRELAGVAVVTADAEAAAMAEALGACVIAEPQARGLNAALRRAAADLAGRGAAGVLVVPGDIPAVASEDIARLLAGHDGTPAVSLVPAHDGEGTCALLVSPPSLLRFAFGPASFARHCAAAARAGITPRLHGAAELPGIAFDVDLPADLARLAGLPATRGTRRLLAAEAALLPRPG
ncbi:2-phospho-L-lactate guanylyltransferase [Ancylobacter lacus]|uniref:2-phospho-L-lactate guanylyltransferase n=1 Tax=Ancylobacter lacus TaxID=2579970 RepID=UPI001BCA9547|nr:2-phospho-L-lactate guanylyltransferase [Ancylobacter lacus]MBS7538961.1 2-phospho-L-lactate guanylyltransferase [Ancylobacter lacus]